MIEESSHRACKKRFMTRKFWFCKEFLKYIYILKQKIKKLKPSVKWTNILSLKVEEIEIVMPNQHYFTIDMTKMGIANKNVCHWHHFENTHFEMLIYDMLLLTFFPLQVLLPLDNPSGNITGTLRRKPQAKLWITHFSDLCKSQKRWHIFYSVQHGWAMF